MKPFCLLLFVCPLLVLGQRFSGADIKLLKTYTAGVFTNAAQLKTDSSAGQSVLTLQPIWPKRRDGGWLLVTRTDTARQYQLWHFYLQDDTTFLLQFLDFKDTAKAGQINRNINLQNSLFLYDLITRHGCEIYLTKTKKGYAGSSSGKDCYLETQGTEYAGFTLSFTKNSIEWKQVDFDKKDNPLPATFTGTYKYNKQVKSLK
jgi:hypothetical protein